MDDRSAGVEEGQDGKDTKPSTLTGRECAKPCSPAKARHRPAERGCLWLSWGDIKTQDQAMEWATYYTDGLLGKC